MENMMYRSFKILERAEGYFAAAAYRELHEPPFEKGKAWEELVEIRSVLADLESSGARTPTHS